MVCTCNQTIMCTKAWGLMCSGCAQMCAVSRGLAAAATSIVASSHKFDLCCNRVPGKMDSKIFLQWAPLLKGLDLSSRHYAVPGLQAFLHEAGNLQTLDLYCRSALDAAQAEHILPQCRKLLKLRLIGFHVPSSVPATLAHMQYDQSVCDSETWDTAMPSALLHKLSHLTGLRKLDLTFNAQRPEVVLACPFLLPKLDVKIHFTVRYGTAVDFSWLQHQPCNLEVRVTFREARAKDHRQLIAELKQLPISRLVLAPRTPVSFEIQHLWMGMHAAVSCVVEVHKQAYGSAQLPLCGLPQCSSIRLRLMMIAYATPVYMDWDALNPAAKVEISSQQERKLHILGGCLAPSLQGQPWQVSVAAEIRTSGLSGMQRRGDWHVLQNDGARSAGWSSADRLQA